MNKKLSFWVLILVSLFTILLTIRLHPWERKKIIDQDVTYYYGYLPATFIYRDWSFFFPDKPGFTGHVWSLPLPNGNRIQKMTMGVAYLYSPFFAIAHFYTQLTGGVANGYSPNYHAALIWAGLFYFVLGLLILRRILLLYFPDWVSALVILTLAIGTNLFTYATWDAALSHVFSFFLFALTLWLFLNWSLKPKVWITILMGFSAGLIVLIRPTNIVFILFIALVYFFQQKSFKEKFSFLVGLRWKWLLLVGSAFLAWLPQMVYWKINAGEWFFYSYLNEPFYFSKPHIINGLFSYRKGWLVYTPVMSFALLGIFLMKDKLRTWLFPVLISTALNIYIIFSWWCWWYGGCFGARPLVEFYVVLAFPLGAFIVWLSKRHLALKGTGALLLLFFIWLNLYQNKQYRSSLLHWDSMSKAAYWGIWGRQTWPDNYLELLIPTDAEAARRGESEYP